MVNSTNHRIVRALYIFFLYSYHKYHKENRIRDKKIILTISILMFCCYFHCIVYNWNFGIWKIREKQTQNQIFKSNFDFACTCKYLSIANAWQFFIEFTIKKIKYKEIAMPMLNDVVTCNTSLTEHFYYITLCRQWTHVTIVTAIEW